MVVLGIDKKYFWIYAAIIVVLGMGLHLYNFWAKMMLVELVPCAGDHHLATDGAYWIGQTFQNPVYVTIYIVWLVALWFHLTHGFWSAFQTIGLSNEKWEKRLTIIGYVFVAVIVLGFCATAINAFIQAQGCCACC